MTSGRRSDPLLLWEAGLVLLLLALFIVLFLLPAAQQPFRPHWFSGPLLAAGLFGVLLLDWRRRRRRQREALREVLEEVELQRDPADDEESPTG